MTHRTGLRLDAPRKPLLSVYYPVGDPLMPPDVLRTYAAAGVDIVELGLKAQDAFADGPIVAQSMARAASGRVADARAAVQVLAAADAGIATMGFCYAEPQMRGQGADWAMLDTVLCLGPEGPRRRIEAEAAAEGVRRVALVPHEAGPDDERRAVEAEAFVFLQYSAGLTGLRDVRDASLGARLARLRAAGVRRPVVVGIGISTPDQMRHALDAGADGIVVGSMAVMKALEGTAALAAFLGRTREVLDGG